MVGMGLVGDVWSQNRSVFQPSPAVLSATARKLFSLPGIYEDRKFCFWHARMFNVEKKGHFLLDGRF